ncbi:MAG: hypothetical protein ACE5DI_06105 [Candidatus Micrarchaeia archaeon]
MGFFKELFGKREVPRDKPMFSMQCNLHPYRLQSFTSGTVDLDIEVSNKFSKDVLTSIVVRVPKTIGFEQSALSQQREIRLGFLQAGETKKLRVSLYGTQRTKPGDYKVNIYAIAHYRDYSYVLNETKKTLELRAV